MDTRRIAAALLAAACLAPGPAMAVYFGVAFGDNSILNWDNAVVLLNDGSFTSSSSEDGSTGHREFIGFGGNEHFTFEVGHWDFGAATFKGESNGCCFYPAGPVALTSATRGFDLGVIGRAPLSKSLGIIARAGMLLWRVDVDVQIGSDSGTAHDNGSDAMYGLGVEYAATTAFALRCELTRVRLGDTDLDSFSVSLMLRPGAP
ncbi:MAG: outer membrane beta-barrel protein [Nevskiaceae bacterium]